MKHAFSRRLSVPAASTTVLLCTVLIAGWCLTPEGHSQAPSASISSATLIPLVAKLKAQQAEIAANQTKIEAQTALLKENLRQAKLYSARAGSGHR